MNGRPSVSICITTYNVAAFLPQCIDSALIQQCNFPLEIVIADDASIDGTREIIQSYTSKHPEIIRAAYNPVNLRYAANFLHALSMCRGEYIAILDGDDYWTDPLKLQKQINFLEQHLDYAVSCHNGYVEDESGHRSLFITKNKPETQDLKQLLSDARNWNSSFVYRNIYQSRFPSWLSRAIHPDYPLHLLHASKGKIHFINTPMGVYRMHERNISKMWLDDKSVAFSENAILVASLLKSELPSQFHDALNLIGARHRDLIAGYYRKRKQWGKFFTNVLRGYLLCPVRSIKEYKDSYYHLFRQP